VRESASSSRTIASLILSDEQELRDESGRRELSGLLQHASGLHCGGLSLKEAVSRWRRAPSLGS
jgi:hypothetical protein